MVVNQSFADAYVGGRSPIGVRVRIGGNQPANTYQIVGVVENARHNTLTSKVKPGFYVTMPQFARAPGNTVRSMSLVVRTDRDPERLLAPVRAAVRRADPRLPISEVRTMDEIVGASIAAPRFAMQLLGGFGLMALVLSAIGIFGIVAHSVAVRQQEFGIRSALGARPSELLRMGLGSGLRQTVGGIAIGVALALPAAGLLGQVVPGVSRTDPATFTAVVFLTAVVALLASLIPAFRAARTEPGIVLKAE
jgi:predicted lysophospholipase L1 biosynthesis ABC-type transport system permease subunit